MFKNSKIKKKFIISTLIFFSAIILGYISSEGQPFLTLYNNGLDGFLLSIIKSESGFRIKQLIFSLDDQYFKVMIGFFFFLIMIFFLLNSKKIIFSNRFFDFFKLSEFKPEFLKSNIYVLIALAAGLGLFLELAIIRIHSSYFNYLPILKT